MQKFLIIQNRQHGESKLSPLTLSPGEQKKPLIEELPVKDEEASNKAYPSVNPSLTSTVVKLRNKMQARKRVGGRVSGLPPMLDAVISCHHTFRFQCTTGFSLLVNITGGNVAGAIGGQCTIANSNVTCPASSIRIHRITIWPSQQNSPQNPPEIFWFSPITVMEKDSSRECILPAGISVCRPVTSVPPPKTLCADWFASVGGASQPMFGLANIAAGDVLDLEVSWTQSNNLLGVDRSVTTGTLKTTYYLYLDGSSSHQLQPVGKPSTF